MFNLKLKRGITSTINAYQGLAGELVFNTETNNLHIFDGTKLGGYVLVDANQDQIIKGEKSFDHINVTDLYINGSPASTSLGIIPIVTYLTIEPSDWDANGECVTQVNGITPTKYVDVSLPSTIVTGDYANDLLVANARIQCISQDIASLTFKCNGTVPDSDISLQITIYESQEQLEDLVTVKDDILNIISNHVTNTDIHITATERTSWNGKIDQVAFTGGNFSMQNNLVNGLDCGTL